MYVFKLRYVKRNCCHCGDCTESCTVGAISLTEEGLLTWDKNSCQRCESCCGMCENEALFGEWNYGNSR